MNYQNPQTQQALCNDYVMGLMGATAQKRFRKLLLQYPEMRQTLRRTESKWHTLSLASREISPPPEVWNRVERQLFRKQYSEKLAPQNKQRWITTWAMAASVFSIVLLGQIWQSSQAPQSQMLALLQDQQQNGWLLQINSDGKLDAKALQNPILAANQDYELWLITSADEKPKSMGILPQNGHALFSLSSSIQNQLNKATLFAVTVEPKGGSPTGQPTSTPIFTGNAIRLQEG